MPRLIPAAILLLLCSSLSQAQTVTPNTFGMNYNYPLVTSSRVAPSIMRMWDESYNGANVHWLNVETCQAASGSPSDPCYTWTAFDAILVKEHALGADTIFALGGVPNWANGNSGPATPPTSQAYLNNFVTAVLARAAGRIKYIEEWNEPDQPLTWSGTQAQMITQSAAVYTLIKSIAPSVIVLGPSFDILPASVSSYYASGMGAYTDVNVVHLYPQVGTEGIPSNVAPEQIWGTIQQIQSALSFYGEGAKPLFSDEGGGGDSITSLSLSVQAQWAAKWPLYLASAGIQRMLWYAYDSQFNIGTLGAASLLNVPGNAYREATKWLTSATFSGIIARVPTTNRIRNTTGAGVSTVTAGTCPAGTNTGTPPTNWGIYAPDTSHGISTQFVGAGTENGIAYVDWRVCGTPTAGSSGQAQLDFEQTTQIAATYGQFWTFGVDMKLILGGGGCGAYLNFVDNNNSGAYLSTDLALPLTPIGAPLQTGGVSYTAPTTSASVAFVLPYITVTYSTSIACDITIRVGAPFMDTGTIWSGTISKPGGYQGQIIWDASGGPTAYTASGSYAWQRNATGGSAPINGSSVTLTAQPILLENQQWKGWSP